MTQIVQKEAAVLRNIATDVALSKINSPAIQRIIKAMTEALDAQPDGVAIAAPQIGEPYRIFIVSKRIFEIEPELAKEMEVKDMVFVNPVVVKISKKKKRMEEGCLSVRYLYGKVSRSIKAKVRAYNEKGELFECGGSGLLAQVFQHEIDHLNGILFIDSATDVRDMPPDQFNG